MTTASKETQPSGVEQMANLSLGMAATQAELMEVMRDPHADLGVNAYSSDACPHCTDYRRLAQKIIAYRVALDGKPVSSDAQRPDLAEILHNDGTLGEVEIHSY